MPRLELEELPDAEQIFVAGSLRLARRAEEWLTGAGIDYAVNVEPFGRSLLFGTERMAAVFYVAPARAAYCRQQLTAAGLGGGVLDVPE
jgi:hypothetical protein